jgi:hypothetical protein
MSDNEEIKRLLSDPCVSFWLRDALLSALQRDPVDAANDAEVLFAVLNKRVVEVQGRFFGSDHSQ